MTEEKKQQIALFRFGVIADFVGLRKLEFGETERLLKQKTSLRWLIPGSMRTRISESTIKGWIARYKLGGNKLQALYPQDRCDRGKTRSIDLETAKGLLQLRKEMPGISLFKLIQQAQQRVIILPGMKVTYSSLYRLLDAEGLMQRTPTDLLKLFQALDDDKVWMLRLLQGKIPLDEIKGTLHSTMPDNDIEALYDCIKSKSQHYRKRAVGILSIYKGIDQETITKYLFIPRSTLRANYKTYLEKGMPNILSDTGKRMLIHDNPQYIEKVFSILHSPPSAFGFVRTSWRQEDIKKVMDDSNMHVSKHAIKKIVDNSGYKYKKARTVLTSNDPQYREKIQAIKDILSKLGPKEKFFSIDEYGPFAIKLQGGRLLVPPGTTKIIPQWQRSRGSLIITAALELSTNQVVHFYSESKNTAEMIKLLNILIDKYVDEECIYFSWDAASWHASKELYKRVDEINGKEFRENNKAPNVRLAPLPTCAQFLNVIESIFSGMARAIIHNSDYASENECKVSIDRYFAERNDYFNKNPKRAGNKIWGKERVGATFRESNNCKDPKYG